MNTGLLKSQRRRPRGLRAVAWDVDGVTYTHSAATFWPALIDEALDCFPGCTAIEMSVLSGETLDERWLDPAGNLEAAFADLPDDAAAGMKKIVDELEISGPPSAVAIKLHDATGPAYDDFLPLETIDSEIFLFLLAWLLRWAGMPAARWDEDCIAGAFTATAPGSGRRYDLAIELKQAPVHEGLIRRELILQPVVTTTGSPAGEASHGNT